MNADALIHELAVTDGSITTKSGMSYRVLGLDKYSAHMSLPVLRRIRDLVNDGAVIVGGKPVNTPSLSDDDTEFHNIADELWGNGMGEHNVGKGKVYAGESLAEAFTA